MKFQLLSLVGSATMVSLYFEEGTAFSPSHKTTISANHNVLRSDKTKLAGGLMDFLNDGKKAFVKSLAGDYDAAAIQERIKGMIEENSVLMLSFTT